jgi:hypothetical protein
VETRAKENGGLTVGGAAVSDAPADVMAVRLRARHLLRLVHDDKTPVIYDCSSNERDTHMLERNSEPSPLRFTALETPALQAIFAAAAGEWVPLDKLSGLDGIARQVFVTELYMAGVLDCQNA